MAQLTPEQLQRLLSSGLSRSQVEQIAASRGDTVPGPTILGSIAQPFIQGALRGGQAIGALAATALGRKPENIQRETEEARVFRAPLLGTIAIEGQRPIDTQRGRQQIIGQGAETVGMAVPVGRVATTVGKALGGGTVARTAGWSTGLGTAGYGVETGIKLQEGAPDPYSPGLGTAVSAGLPVAGRVGLGAARLGANTTRVAYAKAAGLSQDTITTILTDPKAFTAAQKTGQDRVSLGNLVGKRFEQLDTELGELGPAYDAIRAAPKTVKLADNPVDNVLAKHGIQLQDGRLRLSPESPPLSSGDVNALERFVGQYAAADELTPAGFLMGRRALDKLADWSTDTTKDVQNLAREIRRSWDEVGSTQLPGLKDVDAQYSPRVRELRAIQKEYLQRDDTGAWILKDNALTKITNATNKGREQILGRLEKYVPGISQQIQLVRAIEDVAGAAQGVRPGNYVQSGALLGAGYGVATANPILAVLGAIIAIPQLSIPILIAFAKVSSIPRGVVKRIVGKLVEGRTLTDKELVLWRQAMVNHLERVSPGDKLFDSGMPQKALAYANNIRPGLSVQDVTRGAAVTSPEAFKNFDDLSTKLLGKLEGRTTVSRQFIQDLTNSPDLKQAERDLIRNALEDIAPLSASSAGNATTINVPEFAARVKGELLPLNRNNVGDTGKTRGLSPKYENVSLPDELRGPVADYREHVYESPIKTSAGGVHFSSGENPNYFAHSRIEDLPTSREEISPYIGDYSWGEEIPPLSKEPTRRVIEIQSDLFQRGRMEEEFGSNKEVNEAAMRKFYNNNPDSEWRITEAKEKAAALAKLEPYRNTWHERVIREEVKRAAQDGKTKLQFPTGETAMKIEGLGQGTGNWRVGDPKYDDAYRDLLTQDNMKVGGRIQGDHGEYIITDVLGDGKFKAVQARDIDPEVVTRLRSGEVPPKLRGNLDYQSEQFDISGKVDTENPIYQWYEGVGMHKGEGLGAYMRKRLKARRVTDARGVEWWEIDVSPEQARRPVEAFAAAPVGASLIGQDQPEREEMRSPE